MAALHGLYRPRTVDEAVGLLAEDDEARLLAGGATLVAMLNARVIEPTALISLRFIDEIKGVKRLPDGSVRIGAFTRHRETADCALLLGSSGVVRNAASQIANATVRNMGTIGGSVAFADPGLDYPPALVAAGALIEIASSGGRRTVPAGEFFVDWYSTALQPGEMVTGVLLRPPGGGAGVYVKHARVAGDYATASAAACLEPDGRCRVAIGACGPAPLADPAIDAALSDDLGDAALAAAADRLSGMADPLDDVRGSADYRRRLIAPLLRRAVRAAEAALQRAPARAASRP
jgi:carbon-monoxide dehydrogenase medium subunit